MFVQAEGGEDLPVNKDALYEEVRMPERHKICVSKVARIMESTTDTCQSRSIGISCNR